MSDYLPSRDAELLPMIPNQLGMEVRQLVHSYLQASYVRYLEIEEVAPESDGAEVWFKFRQTCNGKPGHIIEGRVSYVDPNSLVILEDTHDCEDNGCDQNVGY